MSNNNINKDGSIPTARLSFIIEGDVLKGMINYLI
jgi:hypothetical protein